MNTASTARGVSPWPFSTVRCGVLATLCLASLILSAGLLTSCGGEVGGERLAGRLIEEDPQILLPRDDLFVAEPTFTWTFRSAQERAQWRIDVGTDESLGDASSNDLSQDGWRLAPQEGVVRLMREGAFVGDELHELKVELKGLAGGRLTLFWAGPGERFDDERSVEGSAIRGAVPAARRFDLAGHRLWGGPVERLRLEVRGLATPIELLAARGSRRVLQAEVLASRLHKSWKIDIDADVRNAWLALPGVDIERSFEVAERQTLRVSYALEAAVQQDIDFAVMELGPDGETELWRESLSPKQAGRWHEARIDLAALAGRQVTLRFATFSAETPDLARGLPVWANPELLEEAQGEAELPNVILISLDTLRSDRMSGYGHDRPTTPNIDRWAERSAVLFENAVAQAPWTLPSHASMFTGLEALRHDVNHFGEAPETLEMLAETLRGAGYTTAAITGGGYLRPQFGFAQGFDTFHYWPSILAEQEFAVGSDRLSQWLREHRSRQFFLLFHTYEIHFPFRKRQPFFDRFHEGEPDDQVRGEIGLRARPMEPGDVHWQHDYFVVTLPSGEEAEHLNDQEKQLLRTMYDSGIAYVDEQLGHLFAELEQLGLDENTLVIITSDHGEALAEGDRGGHNYLYDWNVLIPLIVAFPDGFGAGRRVEEQVRSIDIVPTVLETLGLQPSRALDGVSLRPLVDGGAGPEEAWTYASSANFGLGLRHRNQVKYIFDNTAWTPYLGEDELYDLRRDPDELNDASENDPAAAERLRSRVRRAMDEQHEGLRLEIRHDGEEGVLRGRLKGAWAHHSRVKASDTTCDCLRWDRGARFALEPGQSAALYFEAIAGASVGLEATFERQGQAVAKLDESIGLEEIENPIVMAFERNGWNRSEGGAAPDIGFRLWNAGQRPKARAPGPSDRETLEQLEALGYIDP